MRRFTDRSDAGRRLAAALGPHIEPDAVVVGLARGGVPVAAEVAAAHGLPLDALAVRKIGHPLQPEYAIGAVAPGGPALLHPGRDVSADEAVRAQRHAAAEAEELDAALHAGRPRIPVAGRCVVLVDDGLATGLTMAAAIRWARAGGARLVMVAVPVGAAETVAALAPAVDRIVCLETPRPFYAVGAWYGDFAPVEQAEALRLLDESSGGTPGG